MFQQNVHWMISKSWPELVWNNHLIKILFNFCCQFFLVADEFGLQKKLVQCQLNRDTKFDFVQIIAMLVIISYFEKVHIKVFKITSNILIQFSLRILYIVWNNSNYCWSIYASEKWVIISDKLFIYIHHNRKLLVMLKFHLTLNFF